VVHRDIKPSNVLIQRLEIPDREKDPPLRAVVTDFGLAKLLEGGVDTKTGELMGTYGFMSPEQCLQKGLDGRSDIYSLGVMLYQLTTGQLPFDIKSPVDAVMKHLNEVPPAPCSVSPNLPESIEAIILKAIAKMPEDRYQKAEEMVLALRDAAQELTDNDLTKYAGQRTELSLVTHLQDVAADIEPSRMGLDLTPLASKDQLVIAQKDHNPYSIPLDKQQLTIGRSSDSDIILDHPDVSRQHARLERGSKGWQIIDLKSTNGSYLNNTLLLANVPEVFSGDKTLRIGPFFIHLRDAKEQVAPIRGALLPTGISQPAVDDGTHLTSSTGQIGMTLRSPSVEVQPGNRVEVQVDLFNQGNLVDQFKLRINGLPPTWVSIPQAAAELMPGSTSTLTISVHPPDNSSAKAGTYPYTLTAESTAVPGESVTASGQVTNRSFERFSIDLHPSKVSHGGSSRVTIHNEGNIDGIYSLVGRDPAYDIQFTGEQGRIRIPAGGTIVQHLSLRARNRSLLGSKRTLPFEVQVRASSGSASGNSIPKTVTGQMIVQPYLPIWVFPLLVFLCAICMLGGGLGINAWNRNKTHTSQTAIALEGEAAAAVTALAATQYQSSHQMQTAVLAATQTAAFESTALAMTAIAQGDDDKDGLSNSKELEIGTDPAIADTDQDGLTDGQEVNEYGTNPKNKDTDGDNLTDGDEVYKYHSSPINVDTNGNQIPDGVEVQLGKDPSLLLTDTPLPTATSTPTPTTPSTYTPTPTSSPTFTLTPTPTIKPLVITLRPVITAILIPVSILSCADVGTGGDSADLRGIRFTVNHSFKYVEVRMAGADAGSYSFTAELRRSTGFTGAVESTPNVPAIDLPDVETGTPYQVVRIDFATITVSGTETFTLKFINIAGPSSLYLETYGIGNTPCDGVEETDENGGANPTVRGDPAGFQVFGWP
jgi:hypothetical protein